MNTFIKVKLTTYGIDVYYDYYNNANKDLSEMGLDYHKKNTPIIDENGFTEILLWEFMKIFGNDINMIDPILIEDVSLYVEEEDLKAIH